MLLKSDVSCSSVHASATALSMPKPFIGAGFSFSADSTAPPGGVDAVLEGRRTFFLGGMVEDINLIPFLFMRHKIFYSH